MESKNWQDIYQSLSEEIKKEFSPDAFVAACNHERSSSEIELVDKIMLVIDKGSTVDVYVQCIYAETNRSRLFSALTWKYDGITGRWSALNLPFERFMYLPLKFRYRL